MLLSCMSTHTGQHVIGAAKRANVQRSSPERCRLERAERAGRDALINAALIAAHSTVAAFAGRRIAAKERELVAKLRQALPQGGHLNSVILAGPCRLLVPRSRLAIAGCPGSALGTIENRPRRLSDVLRGDAEIVNGGATLRADEAIDVLPDRLGRENWGDELETLRDIGRQVAGPGALERLLQRLDTEERRLQTPG